jgi:hypothetical protein
MDNNLTCVSREAAISTLETLIGIMPRGTQRDALSAVKIWIEEETTPNLTDEETKKKLDSIFKRTNGEEKGWEWYCRGSEIIDGELVPTEPDDGAEWNCRYNAQAKRWEPTSTPPEMIRKTDLGDVDEG